MAYTVNLTERVKIVSPVMTSKCLTSGSKQTGTIDMGAFRRLMVIGMALSTAATTTVPHATVKILDSTAKGTCSGTAIVTHTIMAQTAGFMRPTILEIRDENVGKNTARANTGRYVRVRTVYGTRGTQVALVVIAGDPRFGPQSNTVTTTA